MTNILTKEGEKMKSLEKIRINGKHIKMRKDNRNNSRSIDNNNYYDANYSRSSNFCGNRE